MTSPSEPAYFVRLETTTSANGRTSTEARPTLLGSSSSLAPLSSMRVARTLPRASGAISAARRAVISDPEAKAAKAQVSSRVEKLLSIKGNRTVDSFHRELGKIMWDECGMARSREGLDGAIKRIAEIREEFWTPGQGVLIPGSGDSVNMELEKAGRVADFLEFGEMMCYDAREREESCGGHFRVEHQFTEADPEVQSGKTQSGEAKRHDESFSHVAAWEFKYYHQMSMNQMLSTHHVALIFALD